jgi:hypothetical protein
LPVFLFSKEKTRRRTPKKKPIKQEEEGYNWKVFLEG